VRQHQGGSNQTFTYLEVSGMAAPNLITPGEKFNFLTALGACAKPEGSKHNWATFRCDCGNVKDIEVAKARRGVTKSCGCLVHRSRQAHNRARIEQGTKFGNITYLREAPLAGGARRAIFLCECGVQFESRVDQIKSGKTMSCGCRKRAAAAALSYSHGHAARGNASDMYNIYMCMLARCGNPSNPSYADYGGRGIAVCERWKESFMHFLEDMGERPEGRTLDRYPDTDGNYEPGNCRWATNQEQALNRRSNVWLEHEGMRLTISQWAEKLGLNRYTLYKRHKKGWPPEKILSA
jgi:hypothetical protein